VTVTERLFDARQAFEHPVSIVIVAVISAGLIIASVLIRYLKAKHKVNDATYRELLARTRSWYVLAGMMIIPILLGAAWVWGFFLLLSLFCLREYAKATELAEWRTTMVAVVLAILIAYFAVLDHWMGLFTTCWPLGAAARPAGWLYSPHRFGDCRFCISRDEPRSSGLHCERRVVSSNSALADSICGTE
jgi:hypothetical protein